MTSSTATAVTLTVALAAAFAFALPAIAGPSARSPTTKARKKTGQANPNDRRAQISRKIKSARRDIEQALDGEACDPRNEILGTMNELITEVESINAGTYCCKECGAGLHGADVTCTGCSQKNPHFECLSTKLKVDCTGNTVESSEGGLSCY